MVSKAKRLVFVSALAISILGAGMYGATRIQADDSTVQSTLVQKIAQKFNLKTEDVQAVFDQQRQERIAAMETKYEQSLTDAVTKGELTEEKKRLILAKHKEIEASKSSDFTSLKSLSSADRRLAMEKKKNELKTWADTNGVDLKYLVRGRLGFGHTR